MLCYVLCYVLCGIYLPSVAALEVNKTQYRRAIPFARSQKSHNYIVLKRFSTLETFLQN